MSLALDVALWICVFGLGVYVFVMSALAIGLLWAADKESTR